MPIETLVLEAIGTSSHPLTLPQLTDMFGIGTRPTLDLVQNLWTQSYIAVHPLNGTLHLTQRSKQKLAAGTLDDVAEGLWEEDRVILLRELVTGHVLRMSPSQREQSGFSVPRAITPSGGRLTDAEAAEMEDAVRAQLRPTFAARERKLLKAIPLTTPIDMPVEERVATFRARVTRDPVTDELLFDVRQPQRIPARVRIDIGERLRRIARDNPDLFVFRNLSARVPRAAGTVADPLEASIENLAGTCEALSECPDASVPALHEASAEFAEETLAHLRRTLGKPASIRVLSGDRELNAAVREAIQTAQRQIVLVCPFPTWDGYERFQNELNDAVRSREVRVFVIWGGVAEDRFLRGLLQLRVNAQLGTIFRSIEPVRANAKLVIRDADLAIVSTANFLNGASRKADLALVVRSDADGEASQLVIDLIHWAQEQVRDPAHRQAVWVPDVRTTGDQMLPTIPEGPQSRATRTRSDQREWAASTTVVRNAWKTFLARVQVLAREGRTKPRIVQDEDHRDLLLHAIGQAKWRLLIASEAISDTAFDAAVERALRARLTEGLPVALVGNVRDGSRTGGLTARVESLVEEFRPGLVLVKHGNHAKAVVWDDHVVVSSFDFLSFQGRYSGVKGYKLPRELGMHVESPARADEVVDGLARQVQGLDDWKDMATRPEPEKATVTADPTAAADLAYAAGDRATREVQRLLRRLASVGAAGTSRGTLIRAFFEHTTAPAEVLALLTDENGDAGHTRNPLLTGHDLFTALFSGLRRHETRAHSAWPRWVSEAVDRLWNERQFFPAAALRLLLDEGGGTTEVSRLPSSRIALLAAVAHDDKIFASRLSALLCEPRDLDEETAACLLGVRVLAERGSQSCVDALGSLSGTPTSPGARLAAAFIAHWWNQTAAPLPASVIAELARSQAREQASMSAREEALATFRQGMQPNRFPQFRPGDETLKKIFGPSGSLRPIYSAVDSNHPSRVPALLHAVGTPNTVVQEAWIRARDRAQRLDGPPLRSILRFTKNALDAAKRWADLALSTPSSLPPHMRNAALDLQENARSIWAEIRASAQSGPSTVLIEMCAEALDPVMELRGTGSRDGTHLR